MFLMWWRCVYGWKMVLLSVLGGWQINNKVGFIEEETSRGMSFMFLSFWVVFLPFRIAASKTTWCFSVEVILSRQKRAFTWYWLFLGFFGFDSSLFDLPCSMFWLSSFLLIYVFCDAKVIAKGFWFVVTFNCLLFFKKLSLARVSTFAIHILQIQQSYVIRRNHVPCKKLCIYLAIGIKLSDTSMSPLWFSCFIGEFRKLECFWFLIGYRVPEGLLCRCDQCALWAWTHYKKSEGIHDTRWESDRPILHYRQQVLNFRHLSSKLRHVFFCN